MHSIFKCSPRAVGALLNSLSVPSNYVIATPIFRRRQHTSVDDCRETNFRRDHLLGDERPVRHLPHSGELLPNSGTGFQPTSRANSFLVSEIERPIPGGTCVCSSFIN
jgi:hypothetical protein